MSCRSNNTARSHATGDQPIVGLLRTVRDGVGLFYIRIRRTRETHSDYGSVVRFTVRDFSEADASAIATWRYEPPYDVYNGEPEMDSGAWSDVWFAVDDSATAELVAFLELHAASGEIEIGLGLRPDLTGRGLGCQLVDAALRFAHQRWHATRFTLDVLPWNERAIRAYEKAGFDRGDIYVRRFEEGTERQFLRMTRFRAPHGLTGDGSISSAP